MALVNHEKREVVFKVVYCGPGMSGKTSNLVSLYSQIDSSRRSEIAMLATSTDRTIFFDLFPASTVVREGYQTKFQIYTVSGYVSYNATRQLVMKGADGLVFVADSRSEAMEENWRAFQIMLGNLAEGGTSLDQLPLVLQYNKRDAVDAVSLEYLESVFNRPEQRFPSFEAVACSGYNVLASLNAVSLLVLHRFHEVAGQNRRVGPTLHRGGSEETSVAGPGSAGAGGAAGADPGRERAGPSDSRQVLAGTTP